MYLLEAIWKWIARRRGYHLGRHIPLVVSLRVDWRFGGIGIPGSSVARMLWRHGKDNRSSLLSTLTLGSVEERRRLPFEREFECRFGRPQSARQS